jgi:tight adherence protein B
MVVLIFIVLFFICLLVVWLVAKPTGAEKKTVQRLQQVTRPNKPGADSEVDLEGILRPAVQAQRRSLAQSKIWLSFLRLLEESNSGQTPKEILLWCLGCSFVVAAIMMFILPAPLIVSGLAIVAMTLPILRLKFLRNRRVNKFEAVLPDALDLMSRALRSGHAVSAAIEVVAEQGREPVASEFKSLFQQQSYGLPFRDALDGMMKRVPSSDLQFAGTAMLVQKETGGNLAEILDRTVEIMRERVRIRGEVKTKTAQGKLTGLILALLPVAMLLIISFTNPEYAHNLTGTDVGHKMLEVSGGMITIGYLFIRKIVNIEV